MYSNISSSSSGDSQVNRQLDDYTFPRNYKKVSFLGYGGFGEVVKCIKKDTNETVAVKIPQHGCNLRNELTVMKFVRSRSLDHYNVVRFIDTFKLMDNRRALAFEMLDVTLRDYIINRDFAPLDLPDVRRVIQQLATALNAMKIIKLIHSDIKLDNIMLIDKEVQPIRVKLIDFGLAFPTSSAKQGASHQTMHYRAPEIILGLPFSEAIDMWSLGIVMAHILITDALFPGKTEFDTMRCIVDLLGLPPDHLLAAGKYSKKCFANTPSGHWKLEPPLENPENWRNRSFGDYRAYYFRNLDEVKTLPLENLEMAEADEKEECVDLLKAMLRLDSNERITPSEVLAHPFITRGTNSLCSNLNKTDETDPALPTDSDLFQSPQTACSLWWDYDSISCSQFESLTPGPLLTPPLLTDFFGEARQAWQNDICSDDTSGSYGSALPPGVVFVQPAPAECRMCWYDDSGQQSEARSSNGMEVFSGSSSIYYSMEAQSAPSPAPPAPPASPIPEDCNLDQKHKELSETTCDLSCFSDDTDEEKEKKKKKKNCLTRLFCWFKKKFSCRVGVAD